MNKKANNEGSIYKDKMGFGVELLHFIAKMVFRNVNTYPAKQNMRSLKKSINC